MIVEAQTSKTDQFQHLLKHFGYFDTWSQMYASNYWTSSNSCPWMIKTIHFQAPLWFLVSSCYFCWGTLCSVALPLAFVSHSIRCTSNVPVLQHHTQGSSSTGAICPVYSGVLSHFTLFLTVPLYSQIPTLYLSIHPSINPSICHLSSITYIISSISPRVSSQRLTCSPCFSASSLQSATQKAKLHGGV